MSGKRVNRRQFVSVSVAAGASAALCCAPAIAQGNARVVVIGGGFAGATCARQLKRLDQKIRVTLVETNPTFIACPFSNAVIAGFRELSAQQFTYEKVVADGIALAATRATVVEPGARIVSLANGRLSCRPSTA
jgi:NADH dehydrogenase FAD-containing subunit